VRPAALRQAREAVDLLAHHPSVVVWCAHDEPDGPPPAPDPRRERGALSVPLRRAASAVRPSWNRTVLDHTLARVLERCDGSRPVVASSGVLPHPPSLEGTDSRLFLGWEHGDARDLGEVLRAWPRLARFVGAFGARSVPEGLGLPAREGSPWPNLDGSRASERLGLDVVAFERFVPPGGYPDEAAWRRATRQYQATLVRRQVETLRRLRHRPCGGFTLAAFADAGPEVGFSVLDHERRPKEAYAALAAACAPVIVTVDPLPATVAPGAPLDLRVHVVSERHDPLPDAVAELVVAFRPDGGTEVEVVRRRWQGELPGESCALVGTARLAAPEAPGRLTVTVSLHAPADPVPTAVNRYEAAVAAPHGWEPGSGER
jgi:beta-mannosidase